MEGRGGSGAYLERLWTPASDILAVEILKDLDIGGDIEVRKGDSCDGLGAMLAALCSCGEYLTMECEMRALCRIG